MNENAAYALDVETPTQWTFAGGKTWVAGWFISKTGAVFRDMRLWIDDRPHAGLFGLPRPEIETKYRGAPGLPHAGFSFLIEPHPGARLLRLELLDHGNTWVEIWRRPIKVKGGTGPRHPRLDAKLLPGLIEDLLKEIRRRPGLTRGELTAEARKLALEAATEPLPVLPVPPFWGALEQPSHVGHTQYGKLPVTGWLTHLEKKIVRLTAVTDPLMEHSVTYGMHRADAAARFPDHPHAAHSQFYAMVDVMEDVPNPVSLKVFAELEDGSRHLAFVQPFRQLSCNRKERPFPELRRSHLVAATGALWRACRELHIRTGRPLAALAAVRGAWRRYAAHAQPSLAHLTRDQEPPYATWVRHNRLSQKLRALLAADAARLASSGPSFCVLVDTRDCTAAHLHELAASLRAQLYPRWEVRFVSAPGGSSIPSGAGLLGHRAADRKEFAAALNSALAASSASHVALVPGHSRLPPDALAHVASRLAAVPALELVYTDEDRMDDAGARTTPRFKPDWSPALALSGRHPGLLSVIRRDAAQSLGGFRAGFDRIAWQDLLWRLGDRLTPAQVAHVPLVCHHGRAAVPEQVDLLDPAIEQSRLSLLETMRRRGWPAEPFLPEAAHHRRLCYHQLQWAPDVLARLPVTIVIPTRDRLHLLQECFELLNETVDWRHVKLIIVDDHSRDLDVRRFLEAIQKRPDLSCRVVRPADPGAPFNYSHLVNLALPLVDTPLLLHLNNDVNALEPGWLEQMVGWFTLPDVGVVGARLQFPDKTLNHTGIVVGPHGGLADTPYAGVPEAEVPDVDWYAATREVSAVTGACLLTRTDLYRKLGGFDAPQLGVAFNDVDYCLRARAAGTRVLYTPQARLMHWGSATRGVTFDEAEHVAFLRRHPSYRDPYVSPSLELVGPRLQPSRSRYAFARPGQQLHLLLITHNLNLEGAPLFLVEYAEHLVREAGCRITVLTSDDGPLRPRYEALGAKIVATDRHRIASARTPAEFQARVAEAGRGVDFAGIDLVLCNTLVSYWGVHLARQANKPSLFYIHESTSVYRFFEKALPLPMHVMVDEAFALATRAFFLCRATEAYYKDLDYHGNFRLVPSWIQVDVIDEFRRAHPGAELRRKHGVREDEILIANIGTVCERKGQHVFIRALDQLARAYRDADNLRAVLVGGRDSLYQGFLREEIKRLGLSDRLEIVMETRAVYDYFGMADLFVCSSFEESFPRVVLEAMAFRTPIVTTDVHGIPEMVTQRQDAYLVPAGDHLAMARMMKTCIDKERSGKTLTGTAYSRVLRYYDHRKVLPRHVELAREAVLDFDGYPTILAARRAYDPRREV
ncbi:MAG TPA: glycosyltransferase [Opitutaceae bacterium]|nr:glycosyltransferase [Opitutaceae bacterium]